MLYIRKQGKKIRRWRVGLQWWHGLNIHFRSNKNIYVVGPKHGFGCQKSSYTKEDFLEFQSLLGNVSISELDKSVLALW